RSSPLSPYTTLFRSVLGADLFQLRIEGARLEALELHEHQVFEQVRQARLARALVARTYAKPRVVGDDGRAAVHQEQNVEPIFQAVALNLELLAERRALDERELSVRRSGRTQRSQDRGLHLPSSKRSTAKKASCGTSTLPTAF